MIKGRGTQHTAQSRFHKQKVEADISHLSDDLEKEKLLFSNPKTQFITVFPKTILNKVESPDIPMEYSLNPYQGCEHGCVYCYARPTHEYWDYNAGIDFESKILVKANAAELLKKEIHHPKWKTAPIVMAGNTDLYQPGEQKLRITRSLLEVFLKFKHPVGMITKNALIERDLDILSELAKDNLIMVNISLTTLDRDLKSVLEPRTSRPERILRVIEKLSVANVPVRVLMAPIIPSLNDHEILAVAKAVKEAGAKDFGYQVVRLNGPVGENFKEWVGQAYPDRAQKIVNQIAEIHGGKINDSRFGMRMRGEGQWAESIKQQYKLAKRKYFAEPFLFSFNLDLFEKHREGQLKIIF
jgi:DNA repair photolyase